MKWQQRVRVTTGLGCWHIMLHLLVIAILITGWKTATLVPVCLTLSSLYVISAMLMVFFQRMPEGKLRYCGDFLEELTTTWYFGFAMMAIWLLSRVVSSHLLLTGIGLAMVIGPAMYSLLVKDKSGNFTAKYPVRR